MKSHIDAVKQSVVVVLVFFEDPYVFENLRNDRHLFMVTDGVFPQEIKYDETRRLQRDVFAAQGTTTNCVGLVFPFLVTSSKGQLVDEIHRSGALTIGHDLGLEVFAIIMLYSIDMVLHRSK